MSLSDADAYDRFMGRYSRPLAVPFADFAGLPLDGRVLDVGCGPGALTAELARRVRPGRVTAVDPSEEFVAALCGRHPGVQVIRAPAEDLPFEGGCFDATLAQLVVNVMDDPVAGLREMARVTRDGGVVAACVWDFTDGGPIGPFWDAAQALDPEIETGSAESQVEGVGGEAVAKVMAAHLLLALGHQLFGSASAPARPPMIDAVTMRRSRLPAERRSPRPVVTPQADAPTQH